MVQTAEERKAKKQAYQREYTKEYRERIKGKYPTTTVFLGDPEESEKRKAALLDIASKWGERGISTLLQKIADGEYMVVKAKP